MLAALGLQDLVEFGVAVANEEDAAALVALATEVAGHYAGTAFTYGQKTVVVRDVRNPTIVLPGPMDTVTAVAIASATNVLSPSAYAVFDNTIQLYTAGIFGGLDAQGWPDHSGGGLLSNLYGGSSPQGAPYGPNVYVTANFGYKTQPVSVNRAILILAKMFATQGGDEPIDPRVSALTVEGYHVELAKGRFPVTLDTTGSVQADRLLYQFRARKVQVG